MAKRNGAAAPGIGHNAQLTEDEKRALTLHHKKLYEAADALVEKAKNDRTAVADLAKSDLGKGALADIKDLIIANSDKKMEAMLERAMKLARYAGLAIGTQQNLFEPVSNPFEDGKAAGMQGDVCTPPIRLALESGQQWIAGWHEGQTVLAAAFKKKRPEPQAPSTDAIDGGALSAADEAQENFKRTHGIG